MSEPKEPTLMDELAKVDWLKLAQKGATFLRELRGDDSADDVERARSAARATIDAIKSVGRQSVGCRKPDPCECAFCAEER